jgi:4-amino-4-deoxy-L-arabinose transferase-like glycosyltransferase
MTIPPSERYFNSIERVFGALRTHPVAVLLIVGVLFRLPFLDTNATADTGFYLYDSTMILRGETPFVDYPARSPALQYTLAGVMAVFGSSLAVARGFMTAVAVLSGIALYFLGREIHSLAAGYTSALIFFLTPAAMTWGMWLKTESVAQLVLIVTFLLALRGFDRQPTRPIVPLVVGVGFGLAFLTRMSTLVHLVAFSLFVAYVKLNKSERSILGFTRYLALVGVGMGMTLVGMYLFIAWPSPSLAVEVAKQHVIELIVTGGSPQVGWTQFTDAGGPLGERPTAGGLGGRRSKFHWMSGNAHTLLPTLMLLLLGARRFPDRLLLPILGLAVFVSGSISVWIGSVILLVFALVVWHLPELRSGSSSNRSILLLVLVVVLVASAYLYRDAGPYRSYILDFLPYLAVLAGVFVAELVQSIEIRDDVAKLSAVAALLLIAAVLPFVVGTSSLFATTPQTETVQDVSQHLESQTEPGDRIFSGDPLYAIEADRRPTADLSRTYWVLDRFPNTSKSLTIKRMLIDSLGTNETPYAVVEFRLRRLIGKQPYVKRVFRACYEPVGYGHEGQSYNVTLYRLTRDDRCTAAREATLERLGKSPTVSVSSDRQGGRSRLDSLCSSTPSVVSIVSGLSAEANYVETTARGKTLPPPQYYYRGRDRVPWVVSSELHRIRIAGE